MENIEEPSILKLLENREMSSVEFVQDYYQLRFDGLTINILSKSTIVDNGNSYEDNSEKFCYLIRKCINQIVVQVDIILRDSITFIFTNKVNLIISLKPEDYRAAEAAIFFDDESKLWEVW